MSNLKNFCLVLVLVGGLSLGACVAQTSLSRNPGFHDAGVLLASSSLVDPNAFRGDSSNESSSSTGSSTSSAIIATQPPLSAKSLSDEELPIRPFSRLAIGTKIGTTGWGGQIATPLARWLNLRGGANFLNRGYGLTRDGSNYYGSLHLKSGSVQADVYPFHRSSFHVSPGVLILHSTAAVTMQVQGGNTFTENDVDYTSDPSDPVHANGTLTIGRTVMPALTIGFGNMITRREHSHWSVPFEIGAAYTGHNTVQFNLAGSVCSPDGCGSVNDPSVRKNIDLQQAKINEDAKRFQIYPIITTGVSYRF